MQNHIRISASRQAPEAILRALRAVDERYDIHYLGDGRWAVGRVVPSVDRRIIGSKMKVNVSRNPNMPGANRRLRIAELCMEGFGVVQIYKFRGEPTDELVQDVRNREYTYQTDREAEFRKVLDEADDRTKLSDAELSEIEYREKNVTPQLFRNSKSFTRGASNGEM